MAHMEDTGEDTVMAHMEDPGEDTMAHIGDTGEDTGSLVGFLYMNTKKDLSFWILWMLKRKNLFGMARPKR